MSSTATIILSAASSAGGSDDDDVECRTCYGVVVACVSMLLFCVLAATTGVVKASAVTGFTVVLFGIVGWLIPYGGATATGGDAMGAARRATHNDTGARVMMALRRVGYSCPLGGAASSYVPPAFAYECPADADGSGKSAGSALCAVCLEDVQRGETVRRMPACGHLFHKDCIDMWLHSHTTCPLCRCDLSPRWRTTKTIATTVAAQSSADALPPV
ncbi:unnamed protein product [Miscanthus lutarioriparius]|uniref:RING-type E3 ubiquitin transferase n=1 Tax=Miscanthus lutarioriparius TaxID=422564 RepID=A0A811PTP7_9POAL|nr:unnamed protein product [Miscanthus lutarioriparius]